MNATAAQLAVSCRWLVDNSRVSVDMIDLLDVAGCDANSSIHRPPNRDPSTAGAGCAWPSRVMTWTPCSMSISVGRRIQCAGRDRRRPHMHDASAGAGGCWGDPLRRHTAIGRPALYISQDVRYILGS